jgi:hypothetical protein
MRGNLPARIPELTQPVATETRHPNIADRGWFGALFRRLPTAGDLESAPRQIQQPVAVEVKHPASPIVAGSVPGLGDYLLQESSNWPTTKPPNG